jgi:hypothetical protein
MSIRNYSTTRNKPQITKIKPVTTALEPGLCRQLERNINKYNDWEISFFNSLKSSKYRIVSGKQYKIVQRLASKK